MRSKALHVVRKVSKPAVHTEQVVRVPETAKYAVSLTLLINLKTVQCLAKSAINVVLRIISVDAVDRHGVIDKAQTNAEVEHQHVVGALRDITDPAEAGGPDPDHVQGVVHRLETPTALKLTSMTLTILMYLELFTVFPGQRQLQQSQMTQTQMVRQRS